MFKVVLVRDVSQLNEHRRDVRRLEYPEPGRLERIFVHARDRLHFAGELVRELRGKALRLTLGEIYLASARQDWDAALEFYLQALDLKPN